MKRSGSNRVPRKIGGDDEEADDSKHSGQPVESAVKRPAFAKAKKRSSLRMSFGPDDTGHDGDESNDSAVITPKKSNLSRIAMEKHAGLRARSPLVSELSRDNRPSYSKDALAELRGSTPSTPKNFDSMATDDDEYLGSRAIDITSKFGPQAMLSTEEPSAIPTEAEIKEKKARRARLAKEQAADSINDDEDEYDMPDMDEGDEFRTNRNEISLRPKGNKYAETRLVRDDENLAEGFDDYVEDGHIALVRRAEREADQRRRAEIAERIADAEGDSEEEDSDDSEAERNAAYEAAQTRAGTYGRQQKREDAEPPPKITPLPDLSEVLASLREDIKSKEARKELIKRKLTELNEEKERVSQQQQYIQDQLQKAGDKYEQLRGEAGMPALPTNGEGGRLLTERGLESLGATPVVERGLDSLGTTPLATRTEGSDE